MDFFNKIPMFIQPVRYPANKSTPKNTPNEAGSKPFCGLCGETKKLTKTPCCDNWICNDEHKYVLMSYARNSCYRNHNRYTLCAGHFEEKHDGEWQTCQKCRESFDTESYVDYATNRCNFPNEKLQNPPRFDPTKCKYCKKVIIRANGGYCIVPESPCGHVKAFVCGACQPVM